ncbi:uncharacterized protein DMAD_03229 [Drosophila madeirensis]|uniref:L-lactate dehydrogenase n=1 Tax=Drosophila madeirensis TaxID=30013 RepID=A0AAU9G6R5_DROMD
MKRMNGLLRNSSWPGSLVKRQHQTSGGKQPGEDIRQLRKDMDLAAERRKEARATEAAEKEAAMLKTRVHKCIGEREKLLQKRIESGASEQQKETLRSLMGCLMTGIRKRCAESVMAAFCKAKAQAGENKIRKMLKKCAEKCSQGARRPSADGIDKLSQRKGLEDKSQPKRNRYAEKLEQCMASEWREVCAARQNLSPEEQAEMVRMHECLCNQVKENCRQLVIKEMCHEAGGEHPRKRRSARKSQKKSKETETQIAAKAKSSPEVEKCVDAQLQSVQSFIKSLSENDATSVQDISECARIRLRKKCEAEIQQRKAQQEASQKGTAATVNQELLKNFRECLYKKLGGPHEIQPGRKVTIAGAGAVGMGCAMALLCQGVTNHLALYDVKEDWMAAERLDLLHGSLFVNNPRIEQCTGVAATKDSRVVVVTAGARPTGNETRLDVAQKSADIVKTLMPRLLEQSPRATFVIVSNPSDVMAWVARKVTNLPPERCFSTGCHLDTARFRLFIGQLLGIAPRSVHGFVIGEHGGSSVPLWSTVSVGGVRLQEILPVIGTPKDPMHWSTVHKDVVAAAFKVSAVKGYTNWAIGLTIADVVSAMFEDSNRVLSLATNVQGICGVQEEVFMSIPCVVCAHGIAAIVRPHLSDWEKDQLQKSAKILLEAQRGIKM